MRELERCILITGGSGFVGRIMTTRLLREGIERIVLPVRSKHKLEDLRQMLSEELIADGSPPSLIERVTFLTLPAPEDLHTLAAALRGFGVSEIIHAAASLDYFDEGAAQSINIGLTRAFLDLGIALNVRRFIYVSTAFSAGATEGHVAETLHDAERTDLTVYSRSKRQAEHLVASSGLPYLILRPAIVMGHSRTGRYTGRAYGLYQMWVGLHRFWTLEYNERVHILAQARVAPALVHYDAYQEAFMAAYRFLEDDSILHVVSQDANEVDTRMVWELWLESVVRPQEVFWHDTMASVRMTELSQREQMFIEYAAVNNEISNRRFDFDTTNLERLKAHGLIFAEVTRESLGECQAQFVNRSERIRQYRATFAHRFAKQIVYREAHASGRAHPPASHEPAAEAVE